MKILTLLGTILATSGLLAAQVPEDPVLRARSERGLAPNLAEGDLPPVPRVITEPPPLPPPEIHHKDLRQSRYVRRGSKHKLGQQTRVHAKRMVKHAPKKKK